MNTKQAEIMIVDSDASARKRLADLLAAKYRSRTAATAEEAIGILAFWNFDLVITRRELSGISGLALCEFVQKKSRDTRAIIVSEIMSPWHRTLAESLGVFDCVEGPLDLLAVSNSIERALRREPARSSLQGCDLVQPVHQAM